MDFNRGIEHTFQKDILSGPSSIINSKEKFFITFPYPYMNGRLHLGHGYTLLNSDFQARFHKDKYDQNVMFPFGFHGTGMPIVASAKKLEHELSSSNYINNQKSMNSDEFTEFLKSFTSDSPIGIILNMHVDPLEIPQFVDPHYWIVYFSNKAKEDLLKFHMSVDLSRSFYTTDMNYYYDSFVNWQFTHLIESGYVYKGIRNVIFSLKDNQPCADHDRHIGEGIKPIETKVILIDTCVGKLMVTICNDYTSDSKCENIITGSIVPDQKFVIFTIGDDTSINYISNQWAFDNISHQYDNVNFVRNCDHTELISDENIKWIPKDFSFGTGVYIHNSKNITMNTNIEKITHDFKYSEPSSQVISRSGDVCIVAKTDQWFINYGDPELKEKVREYINTEFESPNKIIKDKLLIACDWLCEWPCSRNFGLGTFIPGTTDLVDSLSDSTIYMAYYTIAHLVTQLPKELITKNMWDYVFDKTDIYIVTNVEYIEIIKKMKQEFKYWYPVDIRVSGKDLIPNHLIMSLFNHYAIWKDFKYMPRMYLVNGYLTINKEKMSKHTGNFLTLSETIDKYGVNGTRFALAQNDGIEDGDFSIDVAKKSVKYLELESIWIITNMKESIEETKEDSFFDKVFDYNITKLVKCCENAYINAQYRFVIESFHMMVNAKNDYVKYNGILNQNVIRKYTQALITIMNPICPTWSKSIVQNLIDNNIHVNIDWNILENGENIKYYYYMKMMAKINDNYKIMLKKNKDKTSKLIIYVYKHFCDEKRNIIDNYEGFDDYVKTLSLSKQMFGVYKQFHMYIIDNVNTYGKCWFNWIANGGEEEYNILNTYIPIIMSTISVEIQYIETNSMQDKYCCGNPKIEISI